MATAPNTGVGIREKGAALPHGSIMKMHLEVPLGTAEAYSPRWSTVTPKASAQDWGYPALQSCVSQHA